MAEFPKAVVEARGLRLENNDSSRIVGCVLTVYADQAEFDADAALIDPDNPATWDSLPADVAKKYAVAVLTARSVAP